MANIVRAEPFCDGLDKYFLVSKVRQSKDDFNHHDTIKPIRLMEQLISLVTAKGQIVLDPFMGSGSTGVAALTTERDFVGFEVSEEYFQIAQRRLNNEAEKLKMPLLF